ncbi:MAG: threonine/serine exporter family protein [Massilimicrobiota timonensis]
MESLIQCLAAFIGCFGFTFIFRIQKNIRFSIIGSLTGTLGWFVYLITASLNNIFLQSFIAMLCISLLAECFARFYKAPATIFIIIGCFPLVPGSGIYYTMLYAVQGMNDLFMESFLSTLGTSLSLALAILISSTAFQIYKRIKTNQYIDMG